MSMRKTPLAIVALAVIVPVTLAVVFWLVRRLEEDAEKPLTGLTYAEINSRVSSAFTSPAIKKFSEQMRGTRVRWSGMVQAIDTGGRVFVSVDKASSANVEFAAPAGAEASLKAGRTITFSGTIEQLSIKEAFPPMDSIYVRLRDARILRE